MTNGIFLGLGSNQGDRLSYLRRGLDALATQHLTIVSVSPVYASEAHTLQPGEVQRPYFNLVVRVETSHSVQDLLTLGHAVEAATGRIRSVAQRWAPRTLDVDLLAYHQEVFASERLTVPHPRIGVRRFVLRPWADIAPQMHIPAPFNATVHQLLAECPDTTSLARVASVS